MRIAIISDICANLEALQAVTGAIDRLAPDRTICLGNVVGYGADPTACIAWVRERGWPTIAGNWDLTVGARPGYDPGAFHPSATASLWWTRGATTAMDRAWLAALPEEIVDSGLHLVHACPGPDRTRPYVIDSSHARSAFDHALAATVVIGHTHRAIAFIDGDPIGVTSDGPVAIGQGKALINAGSVGQPRDGDPRACWCLVDIDAGMIDWQRTAYDVAAAVAKITAGGLPDIFAERLHTGR